MYQRGSTYIMSVNSLEALLSGLDIIFAPLKSTRWATFNEGQPTDFSNRLFASSPNFLRLALSRRDAKYAAKMDK